MSSTPSRDLLLVSTAGSRQNPLGGATPPNGTLTQSATDRADFELERAVSSFTELLEVAETEEQVQLFLKSVIGRSTNLTDLQQRLLRSYNRAFAMTELLTYDDLIIRLEATIENLKQISTAAQSSTSQLG